MAETKQGPPRFKRRIVLIDRKFQLKHTLMVIAVTAVVSVSLGTLLILWGSRLVNAAEQASEMGEAAVRLAKENSQLVTMGDASLGKEFDSDLQKELAKHDQVLEEKADGLKQNRKEIAAQRVAFLIVTALGFVVLIVLLGLFGIRLTHRIAGPVFRIKRHLREIGAGDFSDPGKLRSRDELQDLQNTLRDAAKSLRERQEREVAMLEEAMQHLSSSSDDAIPQAVSRLEAIRELKANAKSD